MACCNPSLAFCPLFPALISHSLCAYVHFPLYCLFCPPFLAYHSIKVKQCRSLNQVTVMSLLKVTSQRSSVLANMFILQCHQWRPHCTFPSSFCSSALNNSALQWYPHTLPSPSLPYVQTTHLCAWEHWGHMSQELFKTYSLRVLIYIDKYMETIILTTHLTFISLVL